MLVTLFALRMGREFLFAWLALLAVAMNLFVSKQINLLGLSITCADAPAVGYLLGLNLIQEFYGREAARKMIWLAFFISFGFLLLSQLHLIYIPSDHDTTQLHFKSLLTPLLRITSASLLTFFAVQFFDLRFFSYLRDKTRGKHLATRILTSLMLAEILDTLLFSFLGLYGTVPAIWEIIIFSLLAKWLIILFSTPFISFARKAIHV